LTKVLTIYPEKCAGCKACELACSLSHEGEVNPEKSRIRITAFENMGIYVPLVCQQCVTASCFSVCLVKAVQQDLKTGAYIVNENCIRCKLCVYACPRGTMMFIKEKGAATCDLCKGDPLCVKVCSKHAIVYVESDKLSLVENKEGVSKLLKLLFPESGTNINP